MNHLMKAEWFRLRHSGKTMTGLLFVGLITTVLQFVGNEGMQINVLTFFEHSSVGVMCVILGVVGLISNTFNNRLIDHEIMKGTPPMQTILSRILIASACVTVLYYIPTVILLMIFDGASLHLPMLLLLYICLIKLTAAAQAVCIFFHDGCAVMVFCFGFAFESMPLVIIQNFTPFDAAEAASWLTSTQLMMLGSITNVELEAISMPLDTSYLELKIIVSAVVLVAVMIAAAHRSLKEKWDIRLISPM